MTDSTSPGTWPAYPQYEAAPWEPPTAGPSTPRRISPTILVIAVVVALVVGGLLGAITSQGALATQRNRAAASAREASRMAARVDAQQFKVDDLTAKANAAQSCKDALATALKLVDVERQTTTVVESGYNAIGQADYTGLEQRTEQLSRLTDRMGALNPKLYAQKIACAG